MIPVLLPRLGPARRGKSVGAPGEHVPPAHGMFQRYWVDLRETSSLKRRCSPAGRLLGDGLEAAVGAAGEHVQSRHGARQQQGGVGAVPVAEVAADGTQVRVLSGGLLHPGNYALEGSLDSMCEHVHFIFERLREITI